MGNSKKIICRVDKNNINVSTVNEWLDYVKPDFVLFCNDRLIEDELRGKICLSLLPIYIKADICRLNEVRDYISKYLKKEERIYLFLKRVKDIETIVKQGININEISLGDRKYLKNRIKISDEEKESLNCLKKLNVPIVAQYRVNDKGTNVIN